MVPKFDLSLSPEELDAYLEVQRTTRLATISPSSVPHVVPLWFVWVEGLVFMNSTRGNATVRNLETHPVASGVIDDGEAYDHLRGVILRGRVEWGQEDHGHAVNREWSKKYLGGNPVPFGRWKNRIWFHLIPEHVVSWDFRKIAEAKVRAGTSGERG